MSREEPVVEVTEIPTATAKRFLIQFAVITVLLSLLLIGASVYSNHYGYFGEYGQFEFYNDRLAKIRYLKQLPAEQLADAFILGSSDTLPFQPGKVEELFGVRTFNLGNYFGRIEDIWAWTNYLLNDLKHRPKLLIIGLEPWTFSASQFGPPLLPEYGHTLVMVDDLAKYLPRYTRWKYELSRIFNSFSLQNVRTLLRMTLGYKLERKQRIPLEASTFNIDGTNKAYNSREHGQYLPEHVNDFYTRLEASDRPEQFSAELENLISQELVRLDTVVNFLPGDVMDRRDLELLEKTIALCREHDIQLGFVMLPVHPYYFDSLIRKSRHARHISELRQYLDQLQAKYDNVRGIVDASDYRKFPLDPRAFRDLYHMTPDNADRVLEKLKQEWKDKP